MKKKKILFLELQPLTSWRQTRKGEFESFCELRNAYVVCSTNGNLIILISLPRRDEQKYNCVCGIKIYKGRELCSSNRVLVCFLDPQESSGGRGERKDTDVCKRKLVNYSDLLSLDVDCAYTLYSIPLVPDSLPFRTGIHAESKNS